MYWLAFTATLSSKGTSSTRVALWRRLQKLGAISPAGSVYLLPHSESALEALQWLLQETRQAGGEALLIHTERIEGWSDEMLIARFHQARREDYTALAESVSAAEAQTHATGETQGREALERLRRQLSEIQRIDYFTCPEGIQLAQRLAALERMLQATPPPIEIAPAALAEYRNVVWVTRPRPHVDRLACAWLIRRFINPAATIRYRHTPEPDEIPFDMAEGRFTHYGPLCTFEVMLRAFSLDRPALRVLAEIVHEIDLRDGQTGRPEVAGLDTILEGWRQMDLDDQAREAQGLALFDGLYAALSRAAS